MRQNCVGTILLLFTLTAPTYAQEAPQTNTSVDRVPADSLRHPTPPPKPGPGTGPGAPRPSTVDLCTGPDTVPALASSLYLQGEALERAGDLAGAARAYHDALCIAPNFVKANMGLGWIRATAVDPVLRRADEAGRLTNTAFECMMRQLNQRAVRDSFPSGYTRFEAIQVGATLAAAFAARGFYNPVVTPEIATEAGGDSRVAFALASTFGRDPFDPLGTDRGISAVAAIWWAFEASAQLLAERIATYGENSPEAAEAAELRHDVDILVNRFLNGTDATGLSRPGWFDAVPVPH